ncbi:MAG: sugar ABC transporter ATP-binding protein [Ruminococcus sp.]
MSALNDVVVELKDIKKFFPGVTALKNMSIQLRKGEVHGLIGENGAGKSTLIKVLTGVYKPDGGSIMVNGETKVFQNPNDARAAGISCVYQELNIVTELSVTDNMFMGNYVKKKSGFLDYTYMNRKVEEIMEGMNQSVDPNTLCVELGMGIRQMIEIGKAILLEAQVLILDEPTSSLGEKEVQELFRTIRVLKDKGIAILFVSHKLEELFEICDLVTVMRDAEHIITAPIHEMTKDKLIMHMVGRTMNNMYPAKQSNPGDVALEVKNLTRYGSFENVSFTARHGEIIGFSGLVGAGRTEVFRCIFGVDPLDSGEIYVNGKKTDIRGTRDAIAAGMAYVSEDRKGQGLVLEETVSRNLSLVNLKKFVKGLLINDKEVKKQADETVEALKIKTPSVEAQVVNLSGGNQQKVVIGKWLNTNSSIYIFDEPTRGIDVGAKLEVYHVMNRLASEEKCVVMISSELPEILGMCDRVIVMRTGKIMGEIQRDETYFNQEDIMKAAWGGKLKDE